MAQTDRCVVCGGAARGGLKVGDGCICGDCERRMLLADVSSPEYDDMVHALHALTLPDEIADAAAAQALEDELNTPQQMSVDELLASVGLEPPTIAELEDDMSRETGGAEQ